MTKLRKISDDNSDNSTKVQDPGQKSEKNISILDV